ncbi:hypothetical protein CHCC14819_2033 [Bacillus licheniformis]|nr:hypothetical protein CHCC14819_2033 [Bacillus licheniformis]
MASNNSEILGNWTGKAGENLLLRLALQPRVLKIRYGV